MLLKDYHNPDDEELEAGFRELYHFIQKFTMFERVLVWVICRVMGDRLYALIAQRKHSATMRTLHHVSHDMHADFFKRKRLERQEMAKRAKDFVPSTHVE
jgi:hypothetical protein